MSKIKEGVKVKIVKVFEGRNEVYNILKKEVIGKEGIVYGTPHKFYDTVNNPELPQGMMFYSIKDENGNEITPFGWFKDELQVV